MKNNIISNYMKPKLLVTCCYFLLAIGALCGFKTLSNKYVNKENTEINNFLSVAMISYIVFICSVFLFCNVQSAHKFLSGMTSNHIQNLIHSYPQLKRFENILSNPRALRYVATVISNNLNPDEQKQIINIMTQTENFGNSKSTAKAYQEVEEIIRNHINTDSNFGRCVYNAIQEMNNNYNMGVNNRHNVR